MDFFAPKFRRDPNAMVHSLYYGVAPNGTIVTKTTMKSPTADKMETTRTYESGMKRGQGGNIATIILGGMETSLDEIEDILAAKKEKKWVPRKNNNEIADMCRHLMELRNDRILHLRKNPTESVPVSKPKPVLHLPVGYRWAPTTEPGFSIAARI
jgi:hypothetical protein